MAAFCPANHPAVVSKRVSEGEVRDCFVLDLYRLAQFEMRGSVFDVFEHYRESDLIADVLAGDVTFDVTCPVFYTLFEAYSQGIQNDGYFERLVMRTWQQALGLQPAGAGTGAGTGTGRQKKNFLSYTRRVGSMMSLV